ncbi:MAG: MotA/TolQ/ExbB proton channel family protein [Planctomycetota bacterium]|nr:MotA/TolQ/ExbB proton channel family protein [Planctomycetota bacterium]
MRAYATSRLRLVLFLLLIGAAIILMARPSVAADTSGADPNAVSAKPSVFSLVMDNRDPVFFTILALSVAGLTLIIQGFMNARPSAFLPPQTTELIREMITQRRFQELIDFTERDPSFVSRALNPALKRAPSFSSMKEAMETAIGEQTAEQFRKIEYLNIIGNLGPLLGLLGTVLGMIDAFSSMQARHGQANPADLAGGISKALCHTMLGLMLAVPCLAAFGILRTWVDRMTVRGALIAEELLLMIKPAEARPAAAAVRTGMVPAPMAMRFPPIGPGGPTGAPVPSGPTA